MTIDKKSAVSKITKKENYNYLRNMVVHTDFADDTKDIQTRLLDFLDRELMLLDNKAEKNRIYQKKNNAMTDEISSYIQTIFESYPEPLTIDEFENIFHSLTETKATKRQISYRLGHMAKLGLIQKKQISKKVDDTTKTVNVYYIEKKGSNVEE